MKTKEQIEEFKSKLLTHGGVENENSRELIYNMAEDFFASQSVPVEISDIKIEKEAYNYCASPDGQGGADFDPKAHSYFIDGATWMRSQIKSRIGNMREERERQFKQSDIEKLQSEIHSIVGDGEVMQLFNKLIGVQAG